MRIAIIAPGSRGDIQPYIALGVGLQRAGHVVRVVTNQDFEALVGAHGLEVRTIPIDVKAALQDPKASAAIEGGKLFASFKQFADIARRAARLLAEVGLEAARGMDAVLAGFGGLLIGSAIADKLGLRFIQAYNVPMTPTGAFPGALLPRMSLPPRALMHRLSHRITRQVLWQTARMSGDRARVEVLGLPPSPLWGPFEAPLFRRGPILYGLSPSVLPRPADWGESIEVTGFWFTDEPDGWSPPDELARFLAAGPPPVYIGFGSMSGRAPEETTRLVLDAVARARARAILLSGWAGLGAAALPDGVFQIDSIPHSWLFPRVGAVVHHGGAGTTAAALRAGVPQIVVPHHGDQPFWGRVVEKAGAAPRPIPRTRLTAERLGRAIEIARSDRAMAKRAARIGEAVRAEDGVGRAVAVISALKAGTATARG